MGVECQLKDFIKKEDKYLSNTPTKKSCSKCLKEKRIGEYYSSFSPLDADGKLRICKKCLQEMIDENNVESLKNVLRMLDKPFIKYLWESALNKSSSVGEYFKLINAKDFRHCTWADSQDGDISIQEDVATSPVVDNVLPISKFRVTEDVIDKWGTGYTPEEYQNFEKKYSRLITNYGEKTALHTENLLTYIRYRVKEEMSTARGEVKDAKEWGNLASKAATDAKINVSQLSKSDISGGVDVLSQLFEAVETEVGIIPLLPKVLAQPYDDADLIIWAIINYYRRLEDKPKIEYKDIYNFYDDMLGEHFHAKGFSEEEIENFKAKRNNVFRDLEGVYIEPLYETGDEE
jgi:hypothetical protein